MKASQIAWGPTLWVNLLRSMCAGIVWFVAILLFGGEKSSDAFSFLFMPVLYFVFLLPIGIIGPIFSATWGGLLNLLAATAIVPGDPLVALIKLVFPNAVPVNVYYPLNWALVMYVYN